MTLSFFYVKLFFRFECVFGCYVSFLCHECEYRHHASFSVVGVVYGVVCGRCLGKSGEHCTFGEVEFGRFFAEVCLCGVFYSVCSVSEVNSVQIECKYFIFCVGVLQFFLLLFFRARGICFLPFVVISCFRLQVYDLLCSL